MIPTGFGNWVNAADVVAVSDPGSAPIQRAMADAQDRGLLVDHTFGRKRRAVVTLAGGWMVVSSLQTKTIAARVSEALAGKPGQVR